jgi:hypothetical protein
MYRPGDILYITPYHFSDGTAPKPKYFITLFNDGGKLIVATLPTSQDYYPNHLPRTHGCTNSPDDDFNAYCFEAGAAVTTDRWSFPLQTFVYALWVDTFDVKQLQSTYQVEGVDYIIIGHLIAAEFSALVGCLLQARTLKNKVRRLLQAGV